MTPSSIHAVIHAAFAAMFPPCTVIVRGAGEEIIDVSIQFDTSYVSHFSCEIDSDDDGYFRFTHDMADATVLIPYPGS